jgi:hypothetical protein
MKKKIDRRKKIVEYYIPSVDGGRFKLGHSFVYDEPLLEGKNDDPDSLEKLKRSYVRV